MIQSTNDAIQILETNTSDIVFANDKLRTRSATCRGWLNHTEGTSQYTILGSGNCNQANVYDITFTGNVSGETAGPVEIALKENGSRVVGASANAVNKFEDDCVVRAISCATNKSWDYVYDYLSDIAQYEGTLLDKREFVRNYLDRTYQRLDGIYGSVGYVSSLFPNNTILITMRNHIVCSKNGVVYDTFDCRNREVENVWLVS